MLTGLAIFPLAALVWMMLWESIAPVQDEAPYREVAN